MANPLEIKKQQQDRLAAAVETAIAEGKAEFVFEDQKYIRKGAVFTNQIQENPEKDPLQPVTSKQPWEMKQDEFFSSVKERINKVPVETFDNYVLKKGVNPLSLARGTDLADYIGGLLTAQTKADKGKVHSSFSKINLTNKLMADYQEAISNGTIPKVEQSSPLDFSKESDIAYVRMQHKRAIRNALAEGKPVPFEVLKDYPELQGLYKKESPNFVESKQLLINKQEANMDENSEKGKRLIAISSETKSKTLDEKYRIEMKSMLNQGIGLAEMDQKVIMALMAQQEYNTSRIIAVVQKNSPAAAILSEDKDYAKNMVRQIQTDPELKRQLREEQRNQSKGL